LTTVATIPSRSSSHDGGRYPIWESRCRDHSIRDVTLRAQPVDGSSQPVVSLADAPWFVAERRGNVVYFLVMAPNRIERYDLAGRALVAHNATRQFAAPHRWIAEHLKQGNA
jgi:hypothetical protein